METLRTTEKILRENGVRPSVVRLNVLDYLIKNRTHPPADEIYEALSKSIPTLSKTSVYNTLKLFVMKGMALELEIDPKQKRYDGCTDFHGHFKCEKCGEISDFEAKEPKDEVDGAFLRHKEIYYYGICKSCI